MKEYKIKAVPKPRQTQADRWKKRPAVMRARAYSDELRRLGVEINPSGFWVEFIFAVPKSVSKKERARRLSGDRRHEQKPDADNLIKLLVDSIYEEDSIVWRGGCEKKWGEEDLIRVWDIKGINLS
jgi:Holliday junction resolvase RusA-like endonuclease